MHFNAFLFFSPIPFVSNCLIKKVVSRHFFCHKYQRTSLLKDFDTIQFKKYNNESYIKN